MTSADSFQHTILDEDGIDGRADRMVRASVSAYCTVARPTRREAAQLDDLAMPLYAQLSAATLRYLSAALSECAIAPTHLVRRLANEPIDIAAPILARSLVLGEADLAGIAARQGIKHLHAMLHRRDLTDRARRTISEAAARRALPRIEATTPAPDRSQLETMEQELARHLATAVDPVRPDQGPLPARAHADVAPADADQTGQLDDAPIAGTPSVSQPSAAPSPATSPVVSDNAEAVRRKLRAMMEPAAATSDRPRLRQVESPEKSPSASYPTLRAAALTGVPVLFQTALADALDLPFHRARSLFGASGYFDMLPALKTLGLAPEQAFVLVSAAYPAQFPHAEAIRIFLERYELLHPEAALERVQGWRLESAAAAVRARPSAVNDAQGSTAPGLLRAG